MSVAIVTTTTSPDAAVPAYIVDLAELAERINEAHVEVERCVKTGLQHALKAGQLLLEAKGLCKHGEWGPWVERHCAFPKRSAQGYMRLARELPKLERRKAQRVADLPFRKAVKLLAGPPPNSKNRWR